MIEAKTGKGNDRAGRAAGRTTSGARSRDDDRAGAEEQATGERRRAVDYLDLWERHVAGAARSGRGFSAPWFPR